MSWVAWTLALLVGVVAVGTRKGMSMPKLPSDVDGTYVYQTSVAPGSPWMRLAIKDGYATTTSSLGDRDVSRVERRGDTLRFVDEGFGSSGGSSASKVDLATIVDDGQAISLDVDGAKLKFVRQ